MGDPKMPTASSTQITSSASRITAQTATRYSIFFTFLMANSQARPVESNKPPAVIKSITDQFTASENCIAMKGMSNRSTTVITIPVSLLFWVINIKFELLWMFIMKLDALLSKKLLYPIPYVTKKYSIDYRCKNYDSRSEFIFGRNIHKDEHFEHVEKTSES